MVLGIGTDIVEIDRISKVFTNQKKIDKCFTKLEQKYLIGRNMQSFAGNFCAKEAVAKALGTGFREFWFTDIEILRDKNSKPFVNLYNKAFIISKKLEIEIIHISISHCKNYATATAVAESSFISKK